MIIGGVVLLSDEALSCSNVPLLEYNIPDKVNSSFGYLMAAGKLEVVRANRPVVHK